MRAEYYMLVSSESLIWYIVCRGRDDDDGSI